MAGTDKITILSCTGLESMPQEALAVVAQLVSERSTWSSEGGGWLASLQSLIQCFQRSDIVCLFYFSFHNVLSALSQWLWNAMGNRCWSWGAFSWSYPGCCIAHIKRCILSVERFSLHDQNNALSTLEMHCLMEVGLCDGAQNPSISPCVDVSCNTHLKRAPFQSFVLIAQAWVPMSQ